MQEKRSTSIEYVKQLVSEELLECDEKQLAVFKQFAVRPYRAPITRYGNDETVIVIARNGDEVIYHEDIEEGFNVSPIDEAGRVLEHWCNQDETEVCTELMD